MGTTQPHLWPPGITHKDDALLPFWDPQYFRKRVISLVVFTILASMCFDSRRKGQKFVQQFTGDRLTN